MLAHHYLAALDYSRAAGLDTAALAERAVGPLIDAGDRALSLSAYVSARRFHEEALALEPVGSERNRSVVGRARAAFLSWAPNSVDLLGAAADQLREGGDAEGPQRHSRSRRGFSGGRVSRCVRRRLHGARSRCFRRIASRARR